MNLRQKSLLALCTVFILIVATIILVSSIIFLGSYEKLESDHTKEVMVLVENNVNSEIANLNVIVTDWAPWDDTYLFVQGQKSDYIELNLADETYSSLRLNFIIITDREGNIVYGKGFDSQKNAMILVPDGLVRELGRVNSPLRNINTKDKISGFLNLPEGPVILSAQPILHTDFSGPPEGMIIMGRYLDEAEIHRLGLQTLPSLSITPLASFLISPGNSPIESRDNNIRVINDTTIVGEEVLQDINGNDAFLLEVQMPRDIYQQGRSTIILFVLMQIAVGIIMCVLIILLLDRMVFLRLNSMSAEVDAISKHGRPSDRIGKPFGEDELARLGDAINRMLDQIQKANRSLFESETRLNDAQQIANIGSWILDPMTGRVTFSREMYRLFGLDPNKEVPPFNELKQFVHTDDWANMENAIKKTIETGEGYQIELRITPRVGKPIIILSRAQIRRDQEGEAILLIGTSQDITERKKIEDALRNSEEKYRTLVERANDGITIIQNGIVKFGNRRLAEMWGGSIEEILNRPLTDFVHPDAMHAVVDRYQQRMAGKIPPLIYDTTLQHKDGSRLPAELNAGLVQYEEKPADLVIIRDITERKKIEQELKELTQDLAKKVKERTADLERTTVLLQDEIIYHQDSEKKIQASLDEKVILLHEIHHRVKNNLQIIISLLNLQSRYIVDEQTQRLIRESQNRVRAMALVHEKLCSSTDISKIDLDDYIRFLGNNLFGFYGVKGKRIILTTDIRDILVDINTAIPVGLIINELVSNTLKYAFPEGRKGEISIAIKREDHILSILIKENGIGIPADLDWRNAKSLGLRLVISLVEQLQGTIELDRSAGTAFKIVVKEKE
ncbi:MAG: PAS domain S-box protein [Methanoregula sp.]|nr:PAS domain S-box protein [Methanoregula sp.]